MKKVILCLTLITFIFSVACKSKRSAMNTNIEPGPAQLAAVQIKEPTASMEDLKKGYTVFNGPCTRCHGNKNLGDFTEENLQKVIEKMSKKAKISPEEKDALWK